MDDRWFWLGDHGRSSTKETFTVMRQIYSYLGMALTFLSFQSYASGQGFTDILEPHAQRMARTQAQFDRQAESSRTIAISKLIPIATAATRKRDLPTATKAWTEVLRLDQRNKKAREYFTALGRLDEVLGRVASGTSDNTLQSKLVNTKWKWPYKTTHYQFALFADGKASLKTTTNGKAVAGTWEIAGPQTVMIRFSGTYTMVFNRVATQFKCFASLDNGHNNGIGTRIP